MELKLTREQAAHLEELLDAYLRELSSEITATDNPGYRAGLRARRASLAQVPAALGHLLSSAPADPGTVSPALSEPKLEQAHPRG